MPRKIKGRATTHPAVPSSEQCLCLICRQVGHVVQLCPHFKRWERNGVKIPLVFDPTHPSPLIHNDSQTLCQRCTERTIELADLVAAARPMTLEDIENHNSLTVKMVGGKKKRGHPIALIKKKVQIPPVDPVKTILLVSSCPFCRLIFNITYLTEGDIESITKPQNPSDGQLALVPAWTANRLERFVDWPGYQAGDGPYAKCIYTSITSDRDVADERTILVDEVADAFGLLEEREGCVEEVPALGVREVDPQFPDYDSIRKWLSRCDELHHITCRPPRSEDLGQIKLVDVKTRQIVMYPPEGCDYIALSYVWGDVEQASYKLGDVLPPVPATLEDAMLVTGYLEKRYLWADSLCIEQGNESDKSSQLPLMSAIYTGAWATICNLAGQSAHSGLPRVGTLEGVIPQTSCMIGGRRLLCLMPTLSQQISRSLWTSRAWTFQEGRLSPRCLFFTNHQVYFECNMLQCCESLDDAKSPLHTPTDEQRDAELTECGTYLRGNFRSPGPECNFGHGVLRDPFRPFLASDEHNTEDAFKMYIKLVHSYTEKKMTKDVDSINAFSGMLTRLAEVNFKQGYVCGLPIEHLPRALLWVHSTPSRRRIDFPAWSWAGWEGMVRPIVVEGAGFWSFKKGIMTPLRIWKAGQDDHPELVYAFNPLTNGNEESSDDEDGDDNEEEEDEEEDTKDSDEEDDWDYDGGWETVSSSEDMDMDLSSEDPESVETGPESENEWQTDSEPESDTDSTPDTVKMLATLMLVEPSVAEYTLTTNELLIEGLTFKMTFRKDRETWDSAYDSEAEDEVDGLHSERCLVKLEGLAEKQQLRIYGHNATQLIKERGRTEQEFLILSREDYWYALLLIDREGDVAKRVGVASLKLRFNHKWIAHAKPHASLLKLTS